MQCNKKLVQNHLQKVTNKVISAWDLSNIKVKYVTHGKEKNNVQAIVKKLRLIKVWILLFSNFSYSELVAVEKRCWQGSQGWLGSCDSCGRCIQKKFTLHNRWKCEFVPYSKLFHKRCMGSCHVKLTPSWMYKVCKDEIDDVEKKILYPVTLA